MWLFGDALSNLRSDGSVPGRWREAFDDARQRVHRAFAQQDTERVLYESFTRLYTLRHQLMHDGATWSCSVNRAQVRDGRALLALVSTFQGSARLGSSRGSERETTAMLLKLKRQ